MLAVGMDIAKTFNTLLCTAIRCALLYHRVPRYMMAVIGDYIAERSIECPGRFSTVVRATNCGVPQGSVLGPILWVLAYDAVVRTPLPHGLSLPCYAEDKLVMASGSSWIEATLRAGNGVALVA